MNPRPKLTLSRTGAIARKEWIQVRRDPRSLALAFLLPVLMLIFFGYAIAFDVDQIRLTVLDDDRSPESRDLISSLEGSGAFQIVHWALSPRDGTETLMNGVATAYLEVPSTYSEDLSRGDAQLQLVLDGSDANTATLAEVYANGVIQSRAINLITSQIPTTQPGLEAIPSVHTRVWYNPTLESRHMVVPGLIAVLMSIVAAMLTSLTIARFGPNGLVTIICVIRTQARQPSPV